MPYKLFRIPTTSIFDSFEKVASKNADLLTLYNCMKTDLYSRIQEILGTANINFNLSNFLFSSKTK